MPRIPLKIETRTEEEEIIQTITYKNRVFFDRQTVAYLIRRRLEIAILLDLPLICIQHEKNLCLIRYHNVRTDGSINIYKYDGLYTVEYVRLKKICHNCVSWNPERKYCSWKDEVMIKEVIQCDGFLESTRYVIKHGRLAIEDVHETGKTRRHTIKDKIHKEISG